MIYVSDQIRLCKKNDDYRLIAFYFIVLGSLKLSRCNDTVRIGTRDQGPDRKLIWPRAPSLYLLYPHVCLTVVTRGVINIHTYVVSREWARDNPAGLLLFPSTRSRCIRVL